MDGRKLATIRLRSALMKLVVTHLGALSRYVTREFYYVITDLMTTYGWQQIDTNRLWNGPGTIKGTLLDEFGELPETILFWEGNDFLEAHTGDINRLECNKYIFADDLQWWDEPMRQRKLVSFALFDTILSTYAYVWDNFYPEFCGTKKLVWVPHSASPDFMLRYNPHPENSILVSGHISPSHPLRSKMKLLHEQGSCAIAYHEHPGYLRSYDYDIDQDVGRGYAEKINKYRTGFTDCHEYKYVVAKYFEIPATGALLLADDAVGPQLGEIGFIENEHYLPASEGDLEERIQYVLNERNHEELDEIRKRGQELVWERHKTSDRARQIDAACQN
jgi:hypothetical protein